MDTKTLGIVAGTAITSFIAGGLAVKFINREKQANTTKESQIPYKSFLYSTPISEYITENSLREPDVLRQLKEHTLQKVALSLMLTDPIEAQLFRVILKAMNAKKCLEVGCYTGYNVLSMALVLPSDGKVYALDINKDYVNHGIPFFNAANVSNKIVLSIAPAADTMDKLISEGHAGTFDFIYVDADKPGYDAYFEKGLTLLRNGGLLAFDNTLQAGRVLNPNGEMSDAYRVNAKAMDKFNKKIHLDNRIVMSFLNISDGVTFCCKINSPL